MACRICGNNDGNTSYLVREMMYGLPDEFAYFQCVNCGCLQIENIPDDLSRFYSRDYYSYGGSDRRTFLKTIEFGVRNYLSFASSVNPFFKPLSRFFCRQPIHSIAKTGVNKSSRILDVGCGSGTLLQTLKSMGFTRLSGVDPFIPEDLDYKNGLVIRKCDLEGISGEWDLVMFNHSLEHIPDPLNILQKTWTLLAPGAICLIRIPTVSSFAWEKYGVNWIGIDAPRHLFLYSLKSMNLLAAKAGFRVVDSVFDSSILQFYGSEQLLKGIPYMSEKSFAINKNNSIFSHQQIRDFKRRGRMLNRERRGDHVALFLERT